MRSVSYRRSECLDEDYDVIVTPKALFFFWGRRQFRSLILISIQLYAFQMDSMLSGSHFHYFTGEIYFEEDKLILS